MPRRTADVIALMFAAVIGLIVLASSIAVLWIELTNPRQNTSAAAEGISKLVSILVAVLAGYMAGRQVTDK